MTGAFDIDRARRQTPGCAEVIHFNNAGAGLMPTPVIEALKDHLDLEGAIGGYEAAERRHDAIEGFYDSAARLINCAPGEIAYLENATRAWDMAFYALARDLAAGDRILTAEAEYASNFIAFLQVAKRTGAVVDVIPSDDAGRLSLDALARAMDGRVKLIAITHVPTNGGLVNPAAEVGVVARDAGVPYLLDACQSVGQMPIDVAEIGCDMLSATGRKYLRGPRGTGFLYVRRELIGSLEPPFLDLHAATWTSRDGYAVRDDARRFENWESYVAGRIGLGAAMDYALEWGLEACWERIRSLADGLRRGLAAIPGLTVHDLGVDKCGIVTFTARARDPEDIKRRLEARTINVSVSDPASTLLDMERRGLDGLVRASLHYYNTSREIDAFCEAVESMV